MMEDRMESLDKGMDKYRAEIASGLVGFALHQPPDSILAYTRGSAEVSSARQIAMYLTYVGFGISLSRVAIAFGRDRSTVSYACHLIEDRREDEKFDVWLERLEYVMKQLAPLCGQHQI